RDAIRFLNPQFSSITHNKTLFTRRTEYREYWDLIDQSRGQRLFQHAAAPASMPDANVARDLSSGLGYVHHLNRRAAAREKIEQCRSGRIESHAFDRHFRSRTQ